MPRVSNTDYQRFAHLVVSGKTQMDAYLAVHPNSSRLNADRHSHRFAKIPAVKAHIKRLLAKSAVKAQITRQQLIDYLSDALHTPAGDIHPNHPLCQKLRPTRDGTELSMPDKLGAAALLSKLQGWNEPEKHELTTTTELTLLLETLRGSSEQKELNQSLQLPIAKGDC